MSKIYIKLNVNDNHLSYGNFSRLIKELSKNKSSAMQSELFMVIFNVDDINDTTVNNYCVGVRGINEIYKQKYINYFYQYKKNKDVLVPIIINLLSIVEGHLITFNDKDLINNNATLQLLSNKLYNIAKNDNSCNKEFIKTLTSYINNNDLVAFYSEILFFIILEKKQPIYEEEVKKEIIENILSNTLISATDLENYLNIKLNESVNFNASLKKLSDNGNAYACYELGMSEYKGYYMGYPRYIEAYHYFEIASRSNHASSYYMLARLIYDKRINANNLDYQNAYNYLLKAYELGCVSATNLLGLFYLKGIYPVKKDINIAKKYFIEASKNKYAYAYNNLATIYENTDPDKAIQYYKLAADLKEPWACNKIGEYYRKNNEYKKAYQYYLDAINVPKETLCSYALYNLAKYYYLEGNKDAFITPDYNKAIEYLTIAANNNIIEAATLLLYLYIKEYLLTNDEYVISKIYNIKESIEKHPKYNNEIKIEIENNLKKIKANNSIDLNLIF